MNPKQFAFILISVLFAILDHVYIHFSLHKLKSYPIMRKKAPNIDIPFYLSIFVLYIAYGYIFYHYVVQKSIKHTIFNIILYVLVVNGTFHASNYYILYDLWSVKTIFGDMIMAIINISLCATAIYFMKYKWFMIDDNK